jgi:uncharacterized phage protein (TIGR01671 family)
MTREIKFRAERFGELFTVLEWDFTGKQDILLGDKDGNPILREWLKNLNIMQYTGLKDKNGIEIYEGDIIKNGYDDIDVVDNYNEFIYGVIYSEDHTGLGGLSQSDIEVIGNIYQHPHLLKEDK